MSNGDAAVDLYWIPVGAGARFIRFNGMLYEAIAAALQHRPRCTLYHSVLSLDLPHGRYMVEMTPIPDHDGANRGVVAEGPVWLRALEGHRLFRYEVRRWRDGIVPDLGYAVASPVRVTDDPDTAQRVFDALPLVPTLPWGRDEIHAHDMWSCNSIISWTLASAGLDLDAIAVPRGSRAPGWDAGRVLAQGSVDELPEHHMTV